MGVNKTFKRISKNFYWFKMKKEIKKYIKACEKCQKYNDIGSNQKAPIQPMDLAVRPFQKIAIDIIGPLATISAKRNRYVLTVIDFCSRWIEAIPLKDITADTVCQALLGIFTKFGFPDTILSDNGTQFKSQITEAFTRMLNITQVFSARYHPQSNGAVERANKTIKVMLKKVVQDKEKQWDRYLPMVVFSYNETPHESTKFSPFELIFGANPRGPLDIWKKEVIPKTDKNIDVYDLIIKTREEIMYSVEKARDLLKQSNERHRLIIKNRNKE